MRLQCADRLTLQGRHMHKTSHTTLLSASRTIPAALLCLHPTNNQECHPSDTGSLRSQSGPSLNCSREIQIIDTHTETQTHTQTSLFLTSWTPGWQESSESLKWRSTAVHTSKKQTKVFFKSKLFVNSHDLRSQAVRGGGGRRGQGEKKKLPPLSQHTHSQPNHPPWQRETCKSCYEWVPTILFPLQNAT